MFTFLPAPASASTAKAGPGAISWGACDDLPARTPDLECGTLTVPLDHGKPDGDTVGIPLVRAKATGNRAGSLLMHFGGNGAHRSEFAAAYTALASLRTRYDIVAYDQRGSGGDSQVKCGSDRAVDRLYSLTAGLKRASERRRFFQEAEAFTQACAKNSGRILPHLGAAENARDIERLRAALGDEKLNYYGLSFGSVVGGVYATLYPGKVGRMVLDAPLDTHQTPADLAKNSVRYVQQTYEQFLAACVKGGCDLGKTTKAANHTVERLVKRLKHTPLKVGNRELGSVLAVNGLGQMAVPGLWAEVESALASAVKGDGRALLRLADAAVGRTDNGVYSPYGGARSLMASIGTYCHDRGRETPKGLVRVDAELTRISPLFGPLAVFSAPNNSSVAACAFWPVPAGTEGRTVDHTGTTPIVVVDSTGDVVAPPSGAALMAARLRTAVRVTYQGTAHGAYVAGIPCVADAVEGYLLKGILPADGSTCPPV
ncbi:peptidase [Sinosporangium siamense]|uniref:Peptidase n=1 Tax=Sinosporangium siamense TaxID=1367973 RepID=A0A919VGP3_9ACTN|nr:peptidase [Sinosporangium siamense]